MIIFNISAQVWFQTLVSKIFCYVISSYYGHIIADVLLGKIKIDIAQLAGAGINSVLGTARTNKESRLPRHITTNLLTFVD